MVRMDRLVAPPGWPRAVRPPDAPAMTEEAKKLLFGQTAATGQPA